MKNLFRILVIAGLLVGAASNSRIGNNLYVGHRIIGSGDAPTLSACGTSPSMAGSHIGGRVVVGGGTVTSCAVTFSGAFDSAPACVVSGDNTAVGYASTATTTVLTITSSADMGADVVNFSCLEFE